MKELAKEYLQVLRAKIFMTLEGSTDRKHVDGPLIWPDRIEARPYQLNIAQKACQKNTLVVLPTALGKTVISALVTAHFLYNYKHMRVLVMAPTRPLIMQHKESYMNVLKLPEKDITILTGKVPGIYRKQVWDGNKRIIFATPQVVGNDLKSGSMTLRDFCLSVFDECHRARKDYAYTYVARKYVQQAGWPIILGMTASPGADNKKIGEICRALYIEWAEYRSEEDEDVAPYINPVDVNLRWVNLPSEYIKAVNAIREMLNEKLVWLNKMGFVRVKPEFLGRRDLLEVGEKLRLRLNDASDKEKGPIYSAIVAQSAALTLFHSLELLETQGIHALEAFLDRIERESDGKKSYKTIVKNPRYSVLQEFLIECKGLDHPKLSLLTEEVGRQLKENPKSKILVFTQYRDTASFLVERIRSSLGLSVERFVGQATKIGDSGLTQEEQANIIREFRDGTTNVLVATSIAEEGLDIPSVDLVLFYEPVPSEIRYIQRKGRTGRKVAGRTIILATRDTFDMVYLYASGRKVMRMKNIIKTLNQELNPLIRSGPKPEPNVMSTDEIKEIEKEAQLSQLDPMLIKSQEEKVKEFIKDVDKAARRAYMKVFRTGSKGLLIEDLIKEMVEEEELSPVIARAAVDKLTDMDRISKVGWNRIALSHTKSASARALPVMEKDVYEVLVEKVYPGRAVVWINDKWRARVTSEDFEGPVSIMKKNTRFRARGILYHDKGTLCFRIREVVELLT